MRRSTLQWAPVAVAAVLGLAWLTKYEADKHRRPVFVPPTNPIPTRGDATGLDASVDTAEARRLRTMTSCAELEAALDEAAAQADRLRRLGDADEAWTARTYVRLATSRMQRLGCSG